MENIESLQALLRKKKKQTQKVDNSQQNCSCGESEIIGERMEMGVRDAMRWASLGFIQMS